MWKALEKTFDFYVYSLFDEGEKYVKVQSLIISLKALKFIRKIVVLHLSALASLIVCSMSIFAAILHGTHQIAQRGVIYLDLFMYFNISVVFLFLGVFYFLLHEKRWLRAFELNKKINSALKTEDSGKNMNKDKSISYNQDELAHLIRTIDENIDEKFKKMMEQMQKQQATSSPHISQVKSNNTFNSQLHAIKDELTEEPRVW